MRSPKTVSSSNMMVPVDPGNTSMFPGIEKDAPPARSLAQTRGRAEHPWLDESAASPDKRPFSRPGKRARVQMPALPSSSRPENISHDLQALMMSYRSDVDVDVDLPHLTNHADARFSTSVGNDADDLSALLGSFDKNAKFDLTDILPANMAAEIPRTDSRLSRTADRAAIHTTEPKSQVQSDIEAWSAANARLTATPVHASYLSALQASWQQIEGAIRAMPVRLQFTALKAMLQKQQTFQPETRQNLVTLLREMSGGFSHEQRCELLLPDPGLARFSESNSVNIELNQTIERTSIVLYSDAPRSLISTDMYRYMELSVADLAELPSEANRLVAADAILIIFEGPLRSSVMHTLPLCCDVIRHLGTLKNKNDISLRIEKIALTEPFYFRAGVMQACVNAMEGIPPYRQPF